MRKRLTFGMIALAVMLCVTFTAGAKDLVVNDDFNTMSLDHWTPSGNPFTQWIDYYDVGGTGAGFCLAQRVHTGHSGGVTQQVFVIQGVTYTVLADFAYANCWTTNYDDGGNFAIKIDGTSIFEHNCGPLNGGTYLQYNGSGTYVAPSTGYVTFELYNWRDDIETDQITNYADHLRMFPQNPNFIAETREIIASSGGTANLTVKAGAAHANKWYLVLSGISGCHPGFTMNGVKIPLNQDFWTMMAINFALGGIWTGFYTQLDANGDGTAVLNTFGPQAAAKGLVMYFDYIVLLNPTNSPIFASYPIYVMFR